MTTTTIFFTEEHLGSDATRGQAERLAGLLRKLGWSVAVEPGPPWKFETIEDRARFEADWDASLPLLFKRVGEPGLPKTLREVAIEALNLADTCEAGGDKINVLLHRLKDVREAAVNECVAVVDDLFSTVADVTWHDIAALKRKLHGVKRRKV